VSEGGVYADFSMLRYSGSPDGPGNGEEHAMEYEVGAITKRYACSIEIPVVSHPEQKLEQGSVRIIADTIMATWGRVGDGAWDVKSVSVVGARLVRGEVRENERRVFSWDRVEFVPRWVINIVRSNRPDTK
jgi:hypothetical protein